MELDAVVVVCEVVNDGFFSNASSSPLMLWTCDEVRMGIGVSNAELDVIV